MPPVALTETRTSSSSNSTSQGNGNGIFRLLRKDASSTVREGRFGIWLPEGGQTSPVWEDLTTIPGVETPLATVKRRVCADAFRSLEDVRQRQSSTTMGQIRLATSLLVSLEKRILSEQSLYTQFSTVHLGVMYDGELVLEWFYDKGRIQFFIDSELDDSMAVFLDGTEDGPLPKIENMAISATNLDDVTDRAVKLATELA